MALTRRLRCCNRIFQLSSRVKHWYNCTEPCYVNARTVYVCAVLTRVNTFELQVAARQILVHRGVRQPGGRNGLLRHAAREENRCVHAILTAAVLLAVVWCVQLRRGQVCSKATVLLHYSRDACTVDCRAKCGPFLSDVIHRESPHMSEPAVLPLLLLVLHKTRCC
jgi:hypothetical protein